MNIKFINSSFVMVIEIGTSTSALRDILHRSLQRIRTETETMVFFDKTEHSQNDGFRHFSRWLLVILGTTLIIHTGFT